MISKLLKAVERFQQRRKAEKQLYAMDAHMLSDIGITRDEIPYVVRTI